MLRRQARQRREFLYKKSKAVKSLKIKDRKEKVEKCIVQNNDLGHLKSDAVALHEKQKYLVKDSEAGNEIDDEYKFAGAYDPKIMITTSHEPSARLKMFVKELRLIFPGAQRLNRGKYDIKALMHACRSNDVTDIIVVHENRGNPDNLTICHLPYGPTAYFNVSGVVMRHDIPDLKPISEQNPHLVFHNFKSTLGNRVKNILKHLFPVPKTDSKRVMTFANHDDFISFRHHTFAYINRELQLQEIGPRFILKLYQIKLGTLDDIQSANSEWVYRPFMNTSSKRRFLSDEDGWKEKAE